MTPVVLRFPGDCFAPYAAALRRFSGALAAREAEGLVVRDFDKADDGNIWVFGHVLDAIRDAAERVEAPRARHDHTYPLNEIERLCRTNPSEGVRSVLEQASSEVRAWPGGGDHARSWDRLAYMRRHLRLARALVVEMREKMLWADGGSFEELEAVFRGTVDLLRLPLIHLEREEFVERIAADLAPCSPEAAAIAMRYHPRPGRAAA